MTQIGGVTDVILAPYIWSQRLSVTLATMTQNSEELFQDGQGWGDEATDKNLIQQEKQIVAILVESDDESISETAKEVIAIRDRTDPDVKLWRDEIIKEIQAKAEKMVDDYVMVKDDPVASELTDDEVKPLIDEQAFYCMRAKLVDVTTKAELADKRTDLLHAQVKSLEALLQQSRDKLLAERDNGIIWNNME